MTHLKFTTKDRDLLVSCFAKQDFKTFTNHDTIMLWLLNSRLVSWHDNTLHATLSKRWELMARIAECALEDGTMWVTHSGMDCDCVQYSGWMHKCEATLAAFNKLYDEENSSADGPFSLYPVTQAQREEIRPQSRDLAMEAHEDGHAHVVSVVRFDEGSTT